MHVEHLDGACADESWPARASEAAPAPGLVRRQVPWPRRRVHHECVQAATPGNFVPGHSGRAAADRPLLVQGRSGQLEWIVRWWRHRKRAGTHVWRARQRDLLRADTAEARAYVHSGEGLKEALPDNRADGPTRIDLTATRTWGKEQVWSDATLKPATPHAHKK